MTHAEKLLWFELKAKKTGFTFRRQHPVNLFIADFYCHKAKLAIEIDGTIHNLNNVKHRDEGRNDEFEKFGIMTMRFTNTAVINNLGRILNQIKETCFQRCQ